ncbi:isoprenylcysteine carboxylmethyltransferase family protein [Winogradskyella sp.]|uniref:methyltransferase family protein n=1 Tax=Winogradskyella sp. TaxID=1883156 RepID=UPI002603BE44|nr:methyltransferase [Winogradskyella sp.]
MKKILMFTYSIAAYAIGFSSILYWILSVSNLIPEIAIDQEPRVSLWLALLNNFFLIALFGIQHSVMARKWFKDWFAKYFLRPIERSTFVLVSGLLLFNLVYHWQPIGGIIWEVASNSLLYHILFFLFFAGWAILFISSFLINHFDLFGLRQTYLELMGKPYQPLEFRVIGFYKLVRHPIYFGMLLGMWATTTMSVTHLAFAIAVTAYIIIGTRLEEKDLTTEFGETYKAYKKGRGMLIPFLKGSKTKDTYVKRTNKKIKQVQ